jgi:hypothetical protein
MPRRYDCSSPNERFLKDPPICIRITQQGWLCGLNCGSFKSWSFCGPREGMNCCPDSRAAVLLPHAEARIDPHFSLLLPAFHHLPPSSRSPVVRGPRSRSPLIAFLLSALSSSALPPPPIPKGLSNPAQVWTVVGQRWDGPMLGSCFRSPPTLKAVASSRRPKLR